MASEFAHWLSQVRLEIANVNARIIDHVCLAIKRRTQKAWYLAVIRSVGGALPRAAHACLKIVSWSANSAVRRYYGSTRRGRRVAAIIGSEPLGTRLN